ncbi:NaeI family type II restriction endonuclease [Alishewanella jeotgali]|uniref:Type II site-specific deoxyribonuclease n=1 Tax=Alishewanella jeotgali KCTC 22429 TaxID=1129374 RepID=H3ZGD8_9ALTE|nr:NaeI family type II restriction endonuclease [Alishewanella jeotgali]EHR40458.1 type II site-specific deoxyribonuclease [Alishewanella jeotgali KCTC 22429]
MDMSVNGYSDSYLKENPAAISCVNIANSLVNILGGLESFLSEVGPVLRKAVDEVIDMPRTQRFSLSQLEKTEKTYIGTKVEILIRHLLQVPKGKVLDLSVDGVELDVKNTIGTGWMIPKEAVNQHCLLIKINDKKGRFSIGVVFCSLDNITAGMNQDQKRSISPGNKAIFWIGKNVRMQENFFENLSPGVCAQLTELNVSGAEKIRRLCRLVPNTVIDRYIVECVANQKDPMKRLRKNGGARDSLEKEGILILTGAYDSEELKNLGFTDVNQDQFVAVNTRLLNLKS